MKKILIVSRSFYPQNTPRSFRTTELAKEFSRQGHQVTVITHFNKEVHEDYFKNNSIIFKDLGQCKWREIDISGGSIFKLGLRGLKRFSQLFFLYPDLELLFLTKNALANEKNYDLLISIAVPHTIHMGVAAIQNPKNTIATTWIADCGDPFTGAENDSFKLPFYFKLVEKWFFKKADYITVPTKGAIEAYLPEFREKIKVIPQGFKFEEYDYLSKTVKNGIPTFAYAGVFIPGRRDPTEFLSYLISQKKKFEFNIFTRTPNLIRPFVEKSKGCIKLHEFIPRKELLQKLSAMDFLVNFENTGSRQLPSKLIDYVILQKPILSVKFGDHKSSIIDEFMDGIYTNQLKIENSNQYRIENVVKEFLRLAERMI